MQAIQLTAEPLQEMAFTVIKKEPSERTCEPTTWRQPELQSNWQGLLGGAKASKAKSVKMKTLRKTLRDGRENINGWLTS